MILKGKLWQSTLYCSNFTYYTGSRTEVPTAVKLHVLEGAVTYFPSSAGQIHYLLAPNPGCCISSLLVIYTPPPFFALKHEKVSTAKSRSPLTVKIPGQKSSSTHPNDITASWTTTSAVFSLFFSSEATVYKLLGLGGTGLSCALQLVLIHCLVLLSMAT